MGEKICICLRLGEHVPFLSCCDGRANGLALLRCMLNSAACKMWVCVLVGEQWWLGLLLASLRGGRVVVEPLEGLLPAGSVVSGVYIVYALFEHKKEIFSVYIVYAFFIFLPAGAARWSLRVDCVW